MTFGVTRQFVTPVEEDRDSVAPTFWYEFRRITDRICDDHFRRITNQRPQ